MLGAFPSREPARPIGLGELVTATGEAGPDPDRRACPLDRNAAREQSTGLFEVSTAVNQMDQVTQGAMVEETTAAGNRLAEEATNLSRLIARFNLDAAQIAPQAVTPQRRRSPCQRARSARNSPAPLAVVLHGDCCRGLLRGVLTEARTVGS